jgi:tRNA (guanine-N7-)-methyltransferase
MLTADELQRVRAARLYEPPDYFRPLRKAEIFPSTAARPDAPLEVDVGCGDGGFLLDLARAHPERDFLGLEKLLGRARKVARQAARRGLTNVMAMQIDSPYAVRHLLPHGGVSRLHLLFPDPWPKAKHAKNRLVQPGFCADVHQVLAPGGEWLFKTDHPDYFTEAVAVIRASGLFREAPWPADAFPYPLTDFERQWLAEGKAIQGARFVAVPPAAG